MPRPLPLLASTGEPPVDRILQGIIALYETALPKLAGGYYLLARI